MTNVLLATQEPERFSTMIKTFQNHNAQVTPVRLGKLALSMMADGDYQLLIADEHLADMSGGKLIKKTITFNPFINCVAVSRLPHKAFHDAYEGMGVLMQFPPEPGTGDVQKIVDHLDKIHALSKQ